MTGSETGESNVQQSRYKTCIWLLGTEMEKGSDSFKAGCSLSPK